MSIEGSRDLLFRRTSHADIYAINKAAVLQDGLRIWDPSYALSEDPQAWEKAQLDAVVSGAIDRNLLSVAGTEWELEPYSEEEGDVLLGTILQSLLEKIPKFAQARKNLATAKFRGSSFAWVTGSIRNLRLGEDTQTRTWFVPGRMHDIDRRNIRAVTELVDDQTPWRFRWQWYDSRLKQWRWVNFNERPMIRRVCADQESRFGYGRGIMDAIYFTNYIRAKVMKDGLQGIQRWAQGLLVASVDPSQVAEPDKDNTSIAGDMRDMLLEMVGDNVLVKSITDEVEVVEGGGQGFQMVESMLDRVERELVTRIEGTPITLMDGEGGGSRALGAEHTNRELQQTTFDRQDLAEDLDQLVQIVYERNTPTLYAIDPALLDARLPRFAIRNTVDEDPLEVADLFRKAHDMGLDLSEKEIRDRLGISTPDKGEPVLAGAQPMETAAQMAPGSNGQPQTGRESRNGSPTRR